MAAPGRRIGVDGPPGAAIDAIIATFADAGFALRGTSPGVADLVYGSASKQIVANWLPVEVIRPTRDWLMGMLVRISVVDEAPDRSEVRVEASKITDVRRSTEFFLSTLDSAIAAVRSTGVLREVGEVTDGRRE